MARERRVEGGGRSGSSWLAGENPTSHLLVVQVGEVDAIDFNNLVPCLGEKQRGISVLVLSGHFFCWKGSPWRPVSDTGSSSTGASTLSNEQRSSGVLPEPLHSLSLSNITQIEVHSFG